MLAIVVGPRRHCQNTVGELSNRIIESSGDISGRRSMMFSPSLGSLLSIFILLCKITQTAGSPIDNGIDNSTGAMARVYCFNNGLKVALQTLKPFIGHIYVKGMYGNIQCNRVYNGTTTEIGLSVAYQDCFFRLDRLTRPKGMAYMIEIVIQFHPHFTTKIDRGFIVTCLYTEGLNIVTQNTILEGNVDVPGENKEPIPVAQISFAPHLPTCRYTIHKGSPTGPQVNYARVGEMLFHKWQCNPSGDGQFHGILVQNCAARDSRGNRIQLLDDNGCTLDPFGMPTPEYTMNLTMAFVEVHAFKFADDMQISFSCGITMCLRMNNRCQGITPPTCPPTTHDGTTSPSYGGEDGSIGRPSNLGGLTHPPGISPPYGSTSTLAYTTVPPLSQPGTLPERPTDNANPNANPSQVPVPTSEGYTPKPPEGKNSDGYKESSPEGEMFESPNPRLYLTPSPGLSRMFPRPLTDGYGNAPPPAGPEPSTSSGRNKPAGGYFDPTVLRPTDTGMDMRGAPTLGNGGYRGNRNQRLTGFSDTGAFDAMFEAADDPASVKSGQNRQHWFEPDFPTTVTAWDVNSLRGTDSKPKGGFIRMGTSLDSSGDGQVKLTRRSAGSRRDIAADSPQEIGDYYTDVTAEQMIVFDNRTKFSDDLLFNQNMAAVGSRQTGSAIEPVYGAASGVESRKSKDICMSTITLVEIVVGLILVVILLVIFVVVLTSKKLRLK